MRTGDGDVVHKETPTEAPEPVKKRPATKVSESHGGEDAEEGKDKEGAAGSEKLYRPNFYKSQNRWGIKRGKREVISVSKMQFRKPF